MKRPIPSLVIVTFALVYVGCENSFNPKGPYTDKMVVYAILSTQNDTQYVRLYATYNPSGFDPYANTTDNVVGDAQVTISQAASAIEYRYMIVARYDKVRYKDDIGAYVAYSFRVSPGKPYSLRIVSPTLGKVTASLNVPDRGRMQVLNRYVLKGQGNENEDLAVLVWIRHATRGYLVRYYLDFDFLQGGAWVNRRVEMPSGVVIMDSDRRTYSYPGLQPRRTTPESFQKEQREVVYFSRRAFDLKNCDLLAQYPSDNVRVKGAWFVMTQVEQNLYSYYKVANAFQDQHSIRTDRPIWTNIDGGQGVFGAMVDDSLYVDLNVL